MPRDAGSPRAGAVGGVVLTRSSQRLYREQSLNGQLPTRRDRQRLWLTVGHVGTPVWGNVDAYDFCQQEISCCSTCRSAVA